MLGSGLPADGPGIPDLRHDPALLERLAELGHRCWMDERRRSGWQRGDIRDTRRHHPGLLPWDQLPEASKRFNREIVLATHEAVASAGQTRDSGAP